MAAASWPRLNPGQIHLWRACLDIDDQQRRRFALFLSDRERDRASRLRSENHRNQYIAGRGIARELISRYIGQNPSLIEFKLGPHGKPSLAKPAKGKDICFNYTDSGNIALYAFAQDCELGIDIESLAREIHYERIAARKFTDRESAALLELPEPQGRHAFLACWTRKEAYGKAKGFGICYPLNSIDLCVDYRAPTMTIRDDAACNGNRYWTLQQFYPNEEFVAAIVYAGGPRQLLYFNY